MLAILLNYKIWHVGAFFFTMMSMNFTLEITGFDSDKGKAFVEVVDEQGKVVSQLVLPIVNKKVTKLLTVNASGKYGIRVFHDENNNKKLDTNLVGYPTEKWGVSNAVRPAFRAPKVEEILVLIEANDKLTIVVQ